MTASDDPRLDLARRLRSLREDSWPDLKPTQGQLAAAFSAEEKVSGPSISSWESPRDPKIPPESRLRAYATFFATPKSVAKLPPRLIPESQLTRAERTTRDELLEELILLRQRALGYAPLVVDSFWQFPQDQNITIVCSELPEHLRKSMPYTDPESPDHVEMYRYADLDALVELFGHIRAVNPASQARFRTAPELGPDDYTTHLVLLGGVDWNTVTADLLTRVELPVRQEGRELETEVGGFEVIEKNERRAFRPVLRKIEGKDVLVEDVAHFFRGPSPFNAKRTVTICNGCFQRGTVGAVRALTDTRFRDRNGEYARKRFLGNESFSIIFRVTIANGIVVTPDWTLPYIRLHEWPAEAN